MVDSTSKATEPGSSTPTLTVDYNHRLPDGRRLEIHLLSHSRVLALTGPSGAGKTTTLDVIAGLFQPTSARVQVGERILTDTTNTISLPPEHRRIGYVPQDALLFPLHTVKENLLFGRRETDARLDPESLFESLGVQHLLDRKPRHLSGGERQRVALGRAVLSEPDLLLCDEPFNALDDKAREELMDTLTEVTNALSLPCLLVTHRKSDAVRLAQDIFRLEDGRIHRVNTV